MTDIAISNLAWPPDEDKKIFKIMADLDIRYLEISPLRISASLSNINSASAKLLSQTLKPYNIRISSMQALLYRHPELVIFEEKSKREKTFSHLAKTIQFASIVGAKTLVFGSPKNKLRGIMKYSEAFDIALEFFGRIGELSKKHGINFCIEPTPSVYGADFITNTAEAIELISAVNSTNLKLNLDIGSSTLNKEDIKTLISKNIQSIGHIHISEPHLRKINLDNLFHKKISTSIESNNYIGFIVIEMLPQPKNNVEVIRETLTFVSDVYKDVKHR